MFGYIILAVLAIIFVWWVRCSIRKATAQRRMREYPNAMKGFFGFYKQISCDNSYIVNQIVEKDEKYWQEKEREESEISNRCEKLKVNYPNGWETWKQIGHQKDFEDLHIVDKQIETIKHLETVFTQSQEFETWEKAQDSLTNHAISQAGYSLQCQVHVFNHYGNDINKNFNVANLFTKKESCKNENVEVLGNHYSAYVVSIIECAKKIQEDITFIISPDCSGYVSEFEVQNVDIVNLSDIKERTWNENQSFAILTSVADMQQVKYMCELLFSEVNNHPLFVVFSLIKTLSDTEYNINNYKPFSPDHNSDNSYELDKLVELHPYEDAYYFTVKNLTCRTVKKAISTCFKKFDTDTVAERTSHKYKYDHRSQYYNKSADEIKIMWAEKRDSSAKSNRKLRDDIMKILSNQSCLQDETTSLFKMFNKEWSISPYRTNWPIFDRETGIVAIVDCLAYMNGKFILFSWIRTDSAIEVPKYFHNNNTIKYVISDDCKSMYIKSYYNDGLKGTAFANLSDCKFTKYSIEQEVIKYILKKNYGVTVNDSYIVILHPQYGVPLAFKADQVSTEVEQFMISEALNNTEKPTIESEYNEPTNTVVYQENLESIELMELF